MEWQDIYKGLKGKNLQPRLHNPAWISFKIDEQKLREFSNTKPALQQILMGFI